MISRIARAALLVSGAYVAGSAAGWAIGLYHNRNLW